MPWMPKPLKKVQLFNNRQYVPEYRPSAHQRGYTGRWQRERLYFLSQHPLCVMCEAENRVKAATVVDHITPHRGNMELFWDVSNWQALCKTHHDKKTGQGL